MNLRGDHKADGEGNDRRDPRRGGTRTSRRGDRKPGSPTGHHNGLSRVWGDGEDPLAWSIAIFRSGTFQLRAHIVVLMVAASELVLASVSDRIGPLHIGLAVGAMLILVLAREIGRWLIVRSMDRDPAPIVLWPLGSLSPTPLLGGWRREMAAAAGGLTVNMLLWPALAVGLYASGLGWDALVFNPFKPSEVLVGIGSVWTAGLWWLYFIDAWLVGLHLLLPMLPMDSGRVIESAFRARTSARRATWMAARVGLVAALVLFVAAMSGAQTRLMGLAVFGAAVCWLQMRRVQFVHNPLRPESGLIEEPANDYSSVALRVLDDETIDETLDDTALDLSGTNLTSAELSAMVGDETISEIPPKAASLRGQTAGSPAARARDKESAALDASMNAVADAVLDEVLAKISRSGIASLSEDERAILEDATRQRSAAKGPFKR